MNASQVPTENRRAIHTIVVLASILFVVPAGAVVVDWNCVNDSWETGSCWSPVGLPVAADEVHVYPVANANTVLKIHSATGTSNAQMVTVDSTVLGHSAALQQTGGQLMVGGNEIIGLSGRGAFIQSGGTNTVTAIVGLGADTTGNGTYDLSGTGSLSANQESIGSIGTGTFTQSGGTNTVVTNLSLGSVSGSSGTYDLSGTGGLSATEEFIGFSGRGIFTQSGGTNTVTKGLDLGAFGGNGTYDLQGGSLSAKSEIIGAFPGTGIFTQSGGTNTVVTDLSLGSISGSSGTYDLQGGSLSAKTISVLTGGTFHFTDGRLSVETFQGDLVNAGGRVAPGASPGTTTVNGNYTVTDSAAVLEIEIASLVAGSGYDQLNVTGTADLDGILDISLLSGFSPSLADTFDILSADTVTGSFASFIFPTFGGMTFDIRYLLDPGGMDVVRLTVVNAVPEPTSMTLVGSILFALMVAVCRRRCGISEAR